MSALRFVVVAALCAPPLAVRAQADLAYTARGVTVDQTAQSAAQARDAAIVAGQRQALRQVFERLTARSDARRLPNISSQKLIDLVSSLEVEEEKVSPTRYLGRLTVRFKPDEVRDALRAANIAVAETYAKPLVVLPVLQIGNRGRLLWETNPWREAWAAAMMPDGLTPLIVPAGGAEDAAMITADEAVAGNADAVARIARRYQAAGALVVVAHRASETSQQPLRIDVARVGVEAGSLAGIESFARRAREEDASLFGRAVAAVVERSEESWKADVALQFGREGRLVATVPFQGLRHWLAVRQQLAGIAAVRRSEVLSIGQAEAVIEITYVGDETQLRLAMAQRNLDLSGGGGRWLIQSAGAP